jgi:hypothetical protein
MEYQSYSPLYSVSHALIVGINNYQYASPLGYAINDANAIAHLLIDEFGFDKENVLLLADADATREKVVKSFLSYVTNSEVDDRIVFFFAGHGHTVSGRRGEVGFLVPYDGNVQNLFTLIRWDELTRNAELIPAKHMFFVMDACYGGLAVTRLLAPGSMRFLKDMLLRYSRQVLTAGKADEVVADSGGPLAGHSLFTGHFIEAVKGKAESEDGVITANGVMAYVYERVGKDQHSHQTPHYGFIDGDGDFVFKAPILGVLKKEEEKDKDVLISVPSTIPVTNIIDESKNMIDLTKEYLSDTRYTIKLHDLVIHKLREIILLTSEDNFAVQGIDWSLEEFTRRLKEYERIVEDLQRILCCVAYWGKQEHLPILRMALTRLTDRLEPKSGLVVWQALRWYPIILLLYSTGISALAYEKYDNLASLLLAKVGASRFTRVSTELTLSIGEAILELERTKAFSQLPGHERHYVPRSEYLFKLLQPMLDDILFLGRDYEQYFDRFEVLLALVHADLEQVQSKRTHVWGPIGRFGWKVRDSETNPLKDILAEAERQKESWGPLNAGLFGGSYTRFEKIAAEYAKLISGLNWF